jgi:hypothetical protein
MTILGRHLSLLTTLTLTIFLAANAATNDSDQSKVVWASTRHCLPHQEQGIYCAPLQPGLCPRVRTSRVAARDTHRRTMYLPISGSMPDSDQRSKLLPFVGKYVRVVGDVYERKGLHAIVIKQINEDPSIQSQGGASQPE